MTAGLAVLAAAAMGPAAAHAAAVMDDTQADFAAGTTGGETAVDASGSVRLGRVMKTEPFDGTALPAGYAVQPWPSGGGAAVAAGALTIDGARVDAPRAYGPGQVLEFRAAFSADAYQHVGFGTDYADGPWAMISTQDGGGTLQARTMTAAGGTAANTPLLGVDPAIPHTFRIEWTAADVVFSVDGVEIATPAAAIAGPMHPAASDYTAGGAGVAVDALGLLLHPDAATFASRVHDAGDARAVWGRLTAAVTGAGVTFETRSGATPAPDGSWSGFAALGADGAVQSPPGRYLQYRARLATADDRTTPSLDRVDIGYDVDAEGPAASIDDATISGTTATLAFSSAAGDLAGFECSVDGGAFTGCVSPGRFAGLSAGPHTIAVRAVDRLGNRGAAVARSLVAVEASGGTPAGGGSAPDRTAPAVTVLPRSVRASRRGKVALRVTCPAAETRCDVKLRLVHGLSTIARGTVSVAGGRTATARLQLSRPARRRLAARGRTPVSVVAIAVDAAGNRRHTKRAMTLRAPR